MKNLTTPTHTREQSGKPILYFIPHYIASFKYFEKLVPSLSDRYEVGFLLFFAHQKFFADMVRYAKEKNHRTYIMEPPRTNFFDRVAFFRLMHHARYFRNETKKFLSNKRIRKLISVNDQGLYLRHLFTEANKISIDTAVLQWALFYPRERQLSKKGSALKRRVYRSLKPLYESFSNFFLAFILGSHFNRDKGIWGGGAAKRLGVFNKKTLNALKGYGVKESKMSVVGYLDFDFAQQLKGRLDADQNERSLVEKKYRTEGKKHVVFYSSPYSRKDLILFDDAGQYEYTRGIMEMIRTLCPSDQYDITLKAHPAESAELYYPLKDLGVKVLGVETSNYELIYSADLYVADSTVTNYIPIVMDKECLFINFLNQNLVEATGEYFGITEFITDREVSKKKLLEFKAGTLAREYKKPEDVFVADSLKRIVEWVG